MYGFRIKPSLLLLMITVLAGCASNPEVPNVEKQHMELDDAFRARGMYLTPNGELVHLRGHCKSLTSGTQAWRDCVADKVFEPVISGSEMVLTDLTAVKLVRALPKDADLSDLPTQMNLIPQGQYKTWSGELRPFPPREQESTTLATDVDHAFKPGLPDSSPDNVSLSTDTTKTIFK